VDGAVTRRVNLALQGGGAHGAFTWGVLDRLLEEDDLEIAGISGTSAGALNGAALKAGLLAGGRVAAQKRLDRLWTLVGEIGDFRMAPWVQPFLPAFRFWQDAAEAYLPVSPQGIAAQLYSPYALGAAWENPLDPVVRDLDFSQVCKTASPQLFVSATNVRTGKIRVFEAEAITPEVLLASACLPTVFQAVEIDGEAYWDGGYSGNPALFPLYEPELPDDILVVSINPMRREELPDSPLEIQNRINEISFNASLLGELRAINFVRRLIAEGRMERGRMKDVRVHMIADDGLMNALSATTKVAPSPQLLAKLKAAGRVAADMFLADCGDKIGHEPSVNLPGVLS
jgi:NTE family protein